MIVAKPMQQIDDPESSWLVHLYDVYRRGNLAQAEAMARFALDQGMESPALYFVLAQIAGAVNAFDRARAWYGAALRMDSTYHPARLGLAQSMDRTVRPQLGGYLLIKAWGYGFWSDIEHVLGGLLLAELTGRTPVVRWGRNSLFGTGNDDNAFEYYFSPVSGASFEDVIEAGAQGGFFPAKWSIATIRRDEFFKWSGSDARLPGFAFLHRPEAVIVSDFHASVSDLLPWIGPGQSYYGQSCADVQRALVKKYLHLLPAAAQRVESFRREHLNGFKTLAVHHRGTDKVTESAQLNRLQAHFPAYVDDFLTAYPEARIFLLSDCSHTVRDYAARFGTRLVYTNCVRAAGAQGVHLLGHDGRGVGNEVIADSYLAAGCDYFLGSGHSNVAAAVGYLRDWPPGRYVLFDGGARWQRNLSLHDW